MDVQLNPELEAKLTQIADHEGKEAAQIVQEAVEQYVDDAEYRAAVQRGREQMRRGEFIGQEEMDSRVAGWFTS